MQREAIKHIVPIIAAGLRAEKHAALSTLMSYANMVERADNGHIGEDELKAIEGQCEIKFVQYSEEGITYKTSGITNLANVERGSVAVIPVNGVMLRDSGFYWGYGYVIGTRELERVVKSCEASPSIDGIVFQVNSPGGQANGNESLSKVIQACSKPTVVSFEMMASAAVESFIGANEIYAVEKSSMFGSIGTYTSYVDDSEFWESMGVKFVDVYAKQSIEKNKEHREAKAGNQEPLQNMLTKTNQFFIDDVKKARPQIKDDNRVYAGALYNAVEARKIKAIDGIRSLEYAIGRVKTLSRQQSNSTKKIIVMSDKSKTVEVTEEEMGFFQKMTAKLGLGKTVTLEKTELELANEKVAALEAQVKNLEAANQKTQEDFKAALEQGKSLNDSLQAALDTAKKDIANLSKAVVVEGHEEFKSVEDLVSAYNETIKHNQDLGAAPKPHTPVSEKETTPVVDPTPAKAKSYEELIKETQGEDFKVK